MVWEMPTVEIIKEVENVKIADYYTHIELIKELIRSVREMKLPIRPALCLHLHRKIKQGKAEDVNYPYQSGGYLVSGYSGAESQLWCGLLILQEVTAGRITVDGTVLYDKETVQPNGPTV